jgi:flavoprotein
MDRSESPRVAWILSGCGHYLKECLDIVRGLDYIDLFLSEPPPKWSACIGTI